MHGLQENVAMNARATHVAAVRTLLAEGKVVVDARSAFDHPYTARGFDTVEEAQAFIDNEVPAGVHTTIHQAQ